MNDSEKTVLTDLGNEMLREMRRKRRWNIVFRLFYVAIVLVVIGMAGQASRVPVTGAFAPHVALVRVEGVIAPDFPASARRINDALRQAFENDHSVGVILELNTPGGSPVQADRIANEIDRLRAKYSEKNIHVVISDVCASAGMYIASAAENIYANRSSVVGSLGVVMSGFGFVEALDTLGIERRLMTAGEHKGMLDPFLPENKKETMHVQGILDDIYERFKQRIKQGRGARLSEFPDLFSGLIWTGAQAKEFGLIDNFGSSASVARKVFMTEKVIEYTPQTPIWEAWGLQVRQFVRGILRDFLIEARYHNFHP